MNLAVFENFLSIRNIAPQDIANITTRVFLTRSNILIRVVWDQGNNCEVCLFETSPFSNPYYWVRCSLSISSSLELDASRWAIQLRDSLRDEVARYISNSPVPLSYPHTAKIGMHKIIIDTY